MSAIAALLNLTWQVHIQIETKHNVERQKKKRSKPEWTINNFYEFFPWCLFKLSCYLE